MADFKEQNNLFGGMNSDDALRRAPKGDYRGAFNVRKRGGAIQNIRSTGSAVTAGLDPDGVYRTVAVCDDRVGDRLFELIYDSSVEENHAIVRLDKVSKTRHEVVAGAWLGFTIAPIIGVEIIGDILIIAQKGMPPRAIDVVKAEAFTGDLSEFNVSFIRFAPTTPLLHTYQATGAAENKIKGKTYQFAHRYIYKDGSKSTWGPYTRFLSLAETAAATFDAIKLDVRPDIFNSIDNDRLALGDPLLEYSVSEIEIAVRNGSTEGFRTVTRIPVTTNTYTFSNESELGPVPSQEIAKLFDSVPLESEDVKVVGNQVFFANNTEDFPLVSDFAIESPEVYFLDNTAQTAMNAVDSRASLNSSRFKINSKYQLAINFYDEAGRHGLAYTNKDLCFSTTSTSNFGDHQNVYLGFKFAASFQPPAWATSYSVLRSNALDCSFFIQGVAPVNYSKLQTPGPDGEETYVGCSLAEAAYLHIDIKGFYTATKKSASEGNPSSGVFYNFQEGDRVRVSRDTSAGAKIDAPIVRYKNGSIFLSVGEPGVNTMTGGETALIEIYRPSSVNQEGIIFYEIGENYPILNAKSPSRAWSKSDWTWDTPGDAVLVDGVYYNKFPVIAGDVYARTKTFYLNYTDNTAGAYSETPFIQAMNPIPGKESGTWDHAVGRPGLAAVVKQSEKKLETQVRFGGLLIPESRVNNLFSFNEFDQYIYPIEYGPLRKIETANDYEGSESGRVMLGIFERNTISVYLGRAIIQTASGDTQLSVSDKVLGTYNPLQGAFGTTNPESVHSFKGKVWFWDKSAGGWIRYAQNGLINLSRYKMMDHFRSADSSEVRAYFDEFHQELLCKHGPTEVIVFNEDNTRWEARYNYTGCHLIAGDWAFQGASAFKLEDGTDYGTFMGVKYDSYIEAIVSEPGTESKVVETIDTDGTDNWYPSDVSAPESNLGYTGNISKSVEKEWLWSAGIGFSNGTEKKIRGRSFVVTIKLDPAVTTKSDLFDLFVNYSHSRPQTAR